MVYDIISVLVAINVYNCFENQETILYLLLTLFFTEKI